MRSRSFVGLYLMVLCLFVNRSFVATPYKILCSKSKLAFKLPIHFQRFYFLFGLHENRNDNIHHQSRAKPKNKFKNILHALVLRENKQYTQPAAILGGLSEFQSRYVENFRSLTQKKPRRPRFSFHITEGHLRESLLEFLKTLIFNSS